MGCPTMDQFHLKTGLRKDLFKHSVLAPDSLLPTLPAVRKCVSRTECPHGLTGYCARVTDEFANPKEALFSVEPMGSRESEKGGALVLLERAC